MALTLPPTEKLECVLVHVNSIHFSEINGKLYMDLFELDGKHTHKIIGSIRFQIEELYERFC